MSHSRRGVTSTISQPRITPSQMRTAWFLYEGMAYPVATCPTDVFKSALAGYQLGERSRELLTSSLRLDLLSRWYLLCELKKFPLFESKEKAEQVLLERKEYHESI